MLNRNKVLPALIKYFEEKGRVLTYQEYARETDTPVRAQYVREVFGTWAKMEKSLMATENKARATNGLNVDQLIADRNKSEMDARNQWVEASENQDKKALKEAGAQVVAEKLAANAATPEGANANKIAIAGKLPHEQQDYAAMGTTVKVDPATLEQIVSDPEPELVDATFTGEDKTPVALKAAVAAEHAVKTGAVPVDKSTDGGSQGQASTDTLNALGGDTKPASDAAKATAAKK